MKIIILAAGQGTRLRPLTNSVPKCMVEYKNKPMINQLLEVINLFDFDEKILLTGYLKEVLENHLSKENITFVHNKHYDKTNMVSTLFCAEEKMDDDIIISYSDIVYTPNTLEKLIASKGKISVIVDKKYRELWKQRMENPLDDLESLKIKNNQIIEIGKKVDSYTEIDGQYIGLLKISREVLPKVIEFYNSLDKSLNYDGKNFENMYMTTLLQKLIDEGFEISPVFIDGGWIEVDTIDDLQVDMVGNI